MRTVLRLALVASAALLPAAAVAAPITFTSAAGSTSYYGFSNNQPTSTTMASTFQPGGANPTYNLTVSNNNIWALPYAGSSWVSYNPQTGPESTPSMVAPGGYYAYFTDVKLDSVNTYTYGLLNIMADDTASVFLQNANGTTQIVQQYSGTSFPHCAAGVPNCVMTYQTTFTGLTTGDNYLIFVVDQANKVYTGLDYSGAVLTPEPGSLMLLSTGLLSGAGVVMRRFRRQR